MGCTVREKHVRANRRHRSSRPEMIDSCTYHDKSCSFPKSSMGPLKSHVSYVNDSSQNLNMNCNHTLNPDFNVEDSSGWGYCTEEQLEEILLKNLEFLYNEAVSKLVELGYDEGVALKAVLRNGHCYGGMDVFSNVLHNSLAYLNSNCSGIDGCCNDDGDLDESDPVFCDLRQLEEYSLEGMVGLLQQVRPHLSKGDAMWCLLMSDLHVGRASGIEIPVIPAAGNGCVAHIASEVVSNCNGVLAPMLCRFHGGWGFGNGGGSDLPFNGLYSYSAEMKLQRDIELPKRFNLSPSMKSLLKRNVAMFAAGFRANSKLLQQTRAKSFPSASALSSLESPAVSGADVPTEQFGGCKNLNNHDAVNSVLRKFRDLNLDENMDFVTEDKKDEVIVTLVHQIKDLEKQLKERKDWAHQKAMQAARKLSNDLTELKMLRMEKEETQRLKKGKQTLEDSTMKRLSEMENALRKASGQVDRANAAVRRLETENAEIKAEMEASKLSASESVTTCLQAAKREKKCMKRIVAWEKQKAQLQLEISAEKVKILEIQKELVLIKQRQKDAEVKWKEELKAKEEALGLVEEEQLIKEAVEANNKRKLEALRLKIEIDFQRHKDDLLRLEQELSQLKASAQSAEFQNQSNTSPVTESGGAKPQRETIAKMLQELEKQEASSDKEVNCNRECMICMKDEVSIVFLPCAHQVICATCSNKFGRKVKAACPCCHVPIEQRIRVFGASS